MRRLVALLLVIASCGGSQAVPTTDAGTGRYDDAATEYARSAMRAIEGTGFEVLDSTDLAEIVVGLCEGLGVGAIGVAAAGTGIDAPEAEVQIFLEVLRTGLDQVCEERVVVDVTSIYLRTIENAVGEGGAGDAYDEIAVIRAAPVACRELREGSGGEQALRAVVAALFGDDGPGLGGLSPEQGLVSGAVLATATALLCPEHLDEIETLMGSL